MCPFYDENLYHNACIGFFQKKVKKLVDIYIAQWYYLTCVSGKPYEIRHAGVLELADRLD